MMRKPGFTLIELLVYMIIMGFIIVVAGRVFSDSTIMRVRSQNMLKSSEVSGKISDLLREDISQMGVKAWGEDIANSYFVDVNPNVYWDATNNDFSSYALFRKSENFDSLVFKRAEYDDEGILIGVREISYWVSNDSLHRSCHTIDPATCNSEDTDCTKDICPTGSPGITLIGSNLKKFLFFPSKPGMPNNLAAHDILFPPPNVNPVPNYTFYARTSGENVMESINITGNSSTEIEVSGFSARNTDPDNAKNFNQIYLVSDGGAWNECAGMVFKKGETYAVEFEMPFFKHGDAANDTNSTQFLPGMDHIAIGFRYKDGRTPSGASSDVLFYPPQSKAGDVRRHAEFSISEDINDACIALTFAFFSPKASKGKLRFSDFMVFRKADEAFHFPKSINSINDYGTEEISDKNELKIQKKNAKAFELIMEIEHNGEKVGTYSSEGNGMIITTPNNGIIAQASAPP
jgi:type II secretory pathway component PulJ